MSMRSVVAFTGVLLGSAVASAQVIDPAFPACYGVRNLGTPPGVPANLGGITFKAGDPDVLLIGGNANVGSGAIYEIRVTRDSAGLINGFAGSATLFASAPRIDGGLAYGPGGVLFFATYSDHTVGQIKPGSTAPDKVISLSSVFGTAFPGSTGTLQFVPQGFPGAGRLKLASYNTGDWIDASFVADGSGTFNLVAPANSFRALGGGGPEGIVYVESGNPGFNADSVLISEYRLGRISAYEIDALGDPVVATRRSFVTGLNGALGGTRDPRTGNFLFNTFGGGNRVIVINGLTFNCRPNLNNDCGVDLSDFGLFVNAYLVFDCTDPTMPQSCRADFNQDGFVDDVDFVIFVNAYNGFVCE